MSFFFKKKKKKIALKSLFCIFEVGHVFRMYHFSIILCNLLLYILVYISETLANRQKKRCISSKNIFVIYIH